MMVTYLQCNILSHDVTSGSDITPHNKIGKPLVDNRFYNGTKDIQYKEHCVNDEKISKFLGQKSNFNVILVNCDNYDRI